MSAPRVAFVGYQFGAGCALRGRWPASALGYRYFSKPEQMGHKKTWDIIFLIKYALNDSGRMIRQRCGRLVLDVLDGWGTNCAKDASTMSASAFWRHIHREIKFDDILATTPSAYDSIRSALCLKAGSGAPSVHYAPHQCDHRLKPAYNPRGPVVYVGSMKYLNAAVPQLDQACRKLGRRLIVGYRHHPEMLHGASLALALRCGKMRGELPAVAKPQIKLENAAAVGLPVLASAHPCCLSARPECVFADDGPKTVSDWCELIDRALSSKPLENPYRMEHHLQVLQSIIDGKQVPPPAGTQVNLGCGRKKYDGFLGIDLYSRFAHIQQDLRVVELPNQSVRLALLIHVLEHLPRPDGMALLRKVCGWLLPGGCLHIEVPDLNKCRHLIKEGTKLEDKKLALQGLLGLAGGRRRRQDEWGDWLIDNTRSWYKHAGSDDLLASIPDEWKEPGAAHVAMWTEESVRKALIEAGFRYVTETEGCFGHGVGRERDSYLIGWK